MIQEQRSKNVAEVIDGLARGLGPISSVKITSDDGSVPLTPMIQLESVVFRSDPEVPDPNDITL